MPPKRSVRVRHQNEKALDAAPPPPKRAKPARKGRKAATSSTSQHRNILPEAPTADRPEEVTLPPPQAPVFSTDMLDQLVTRVADEVTRRLMGPSGNSTVMPTTSCNQPEVTGPSSHGFLTEIPVSCPASLQQNVQSATTHGLAASIVQGSVDAA